MAEAFVVSTCNRVEVYADVDRFHGGVTAVCELLARHCGCRRTFSITMLWTAALTKAAMS